MGQARRTVALCCLDAASVRFLRELIDLLTICLADLGYAGELSVGTLMPDRINIVLDYYKAESLELFSGHRYVVYQLEQLSPHCRFLTSTTVRVLRDALAVWDFAAENLELLKTLHIGACWLPVGHHPRMEVVPRMERDIDVLFYGTLNRRRETVLQRLAREPLRLQVLQGVFGRERDLYVGRSRLVLNIHYFEVKLLEIVRISYLLSNNAFVLTEHAAVNPYAGLGLASAAYHDLAGACLDWLADAASLEAGRLHVASRFAATFPMLPRLAPLVAALF